MRTAQWILAAVMATVPAAAAWSAEGNGLTPNADKLPWSGWQGRWSVAVQEPAFRSGLVGAEKSGLQVGAVSLMGDYFFTRSLFGAAATGGLHATSGLIVSSRAQPWNGQPVFGTQPGAFSVSRRSASMVTPLGGDATADNPTVPYLGVGYIGASSKGGWSVSADLGLVALAAGNAVKFGRVFSGSQSLDDLVRDMRVAPVVQLGVSYSF